MRKLINSVGPCPANVNPLGGRRNTEPARRAESRGASAPRPGCAREGLRPKTPVVSDASYRGHAGLDFEATAADCEARSSAEVEASFGESEEAAPDELALESVPEDSWTEGVKAAEERPFSAKGAKGTRDENCRLQIARFEESFGEEKEIRALRRALQPSEPSLETVMAFCEPLSVEAALEPFLR